MTKTKLTNDQSRLIDRALANGGRVPVRRGSKRSARCLERKGIGRVTIEWVEINRPWYEQCGLRKVTWNGDRTAYLAHVFSLEALAPVRKIVAEYAALPSYFSALGAEEEERGSGTISKIMARRRASAGLSELVKLVAMVAGVNVATPV